MEIFLENITLPEQGAAEIHLNRSFHINISAKAAQRQVNRWVLLEVSCVMGAQPPTLVIGERAVWRVPVVLSASHVGIVGTAGTVDVDVETGAMDNTPERKRALECGAMALAPKIPPYTPRTEMPEKYLAKNLKPTHSKPIRSQQQKAELAALFSELSPENQTEVLVSL